MEKIKCSQCGYDNPGDNRFCIKCGNEIKVTQELPVEPTQAESELVSPPEETEGIKCPRCDYLNQPAVRYCVKCGAWLQAPPSPGEEFAPPPLEIKAPKPDLIANAVAAWGRFMREKFVHRKYGLVDFCSLAIIGAGVLVLICTWLSWGKGSLGSFSGWDWLQVGKMAPSGMGDWGNPIMVSYRGLPLFTGVVTMAMGGMLASLGIVLFLAGNRNLWIVALVLSALALCLALTNFLSLLITAGFSPGAGTIMLLIFSLLALVIAIVGLWRGGSALGAATKPILGSETADIAAT